MHLRRLIIPAVAVLLGLVLTGCKGVPTRTEQQARREAQAVTRAFRPGGQPPALPALSSDSALADLLRYSMLRRPEVEAAYYAWLSSVERITVERSLPDPRLTFEADITDFVETAMPGLMLDFPGPGKLKARAAVASAESRARYFAFERSVLDAAFGVKKSYYQLASVIGQIRINRETLALLGDLELMARRQNEAGLVTLADVLRAQIEQDRMRTEILNLEDSRATLVAQLKRALGLKPGEPDPPVPSRFDHGLVQVPPERLLETALRRNPGLKGMETEVRQAEAAIGLASRSRIPDFNAGIKVDALASPVMVRPELGVTLPIWRDKIAAEIAAAQADKQAAEARLNAEQIRLAVEVAERSYMYREASRNLNLYEKTLLPKARLSVDASRAGYLSGKVDFLTLLNSWQTLLSFELVRVQAETQRELALAELSLLVAGVPPPGAPLPLPEEARAKTFETGAKDYAK